MLRIAVPISPEGWDEEKQEFIEPKYEILELEHSLVSISKWESKWCKPYFSKEAKTYEEIFDYIKDMTITQNVKLEVYGCLTEENIKDIDEYINAPMTATRITDDKKGTINREIVTSELIYYWMKALQIPFECQTWHINRLLTLIKVCNIKDAPPKKMGKKAIMNRNTALNASRRKRLNTKG